MTIWQTPVTLEEINQRNQESMAGFLGIEFTEIGDECLIAKMPVTQQIKQPIGIMHGGASCVFTRA